MESLSPNFFVKDMQETILFYQALGFQLIMSVPESGTDLVWTMMVNGNITFMFQTFESLAGELPEISRQNGGSLLFYIKLTGLLSFLMR